MALRPKNTSFPYNYSDTGKPKCKRSDINMINVCENNNNTTNRASILPILRDEKLSYCFARYCRSSMNHTGLCFYNDTYTSNFDENQLQLFVTAHEKFPNPTCLIEINEMGHKSKKTVDFVCKWSGVHLGVNASLAVTNIQTQINNTCANYKSMVKAKKKKKKKKKRLPSLLLNKDEEADAHCTLRVPNLSTQPSCHFSFYIFPRIANVAVGENVTLTCPHDAN